MITKVKWNNHEILGNLELNFTKNDGSPYSTIVLAGENGTGKTTILETLSTFLNLGSIEPFEFIEYKIEKGKNQINLTITGDKVSHLIGYKGKTIESFQSLLNAMLQRENEESAKVFVEVNDYKKRKEEKLKNLANKMANNVIKFRKPIRLEPMSAYERLIIHTELAKRDDVETESQGEEPRRRVVIKKKYN